MGEPEIGGPHDVRVRLRAAGINPIDCKLRAEGTTGGSLPRSSAGTAPGWWTLEQAAAHFDAGDLRVEVGVTFPLDRAAHAHRVLEAGQVAGKGVLTMT